MLTITIKIIELIVSFFILQKYNHLQPPDAANFYDGGCDSELNHIF